MCNKYSRSPPGDITDRIGEKILSGIYFGAIIGYNYEISDKRNHHWFVKFSKNKICSLRYKPRCRRNWRTASEILSPGYVEWAPSLRKNTRKKRINQITQRDGFLCCFCNNRLKSDISIEHVISRSKGGNNDLSNLKLAHKKCNVEAEKTK